MAHDHIKGTPIENHLLVTRLIEGIYVMTTTTSILSYMGHGHSYQISLECGRQSLSVTETTESRASSVKAWWMQIEYQNYRLKSKV